MSAVKDAPETPRPPMTPADIAALLALLGAALLTERSRNEKHPHLPKCGGSRVVRIPDHPGRYASGNNIYTTRFTLLGKIPVIRYVCCDCGYAEDWVESPAEWVQLWQTYGDMPGAER